MAPLLVWQAPAQCPDAASMQSRLEDVQRGLAFDWVQGAEVRARISGSVGSQWVLDLELKGREASSGRRRLTATNCDELADAAAVAIAFALGGAAEEGAAAEGAAVAETKQRAASAQPSTAAVDQNVDDPRSDATPALNSEHWAQRREPRSAFAVAAGALLDSGFLGRPALGATLALQARRDEWGLGLYGVWLAPQERGLAADQSVEFAWLSAGLRACYQALGGALALDGCLGIELGSLSTSAQGLVLARDTRVSEWAPFAGAGLAWRASEDWALVSRLEALAPLLSHKFVVNLDQQIHETPSGVLRFSLGVEGDFFSR